MNALPALSAGWYKCAPPDLRLKAKAVCPPGKHSTNGTTPPSINKYFIYDTHLKMRIKLGRGERQKPVSSKCVYKITRNGGISIHQTLRIKEEEAEGAICANSGDNPLPSEL